MPKDPKPLTTGERASWNKFLHFVNSKGYTGNTKLDERDQSIGQSLLDEYNKNAGADTINADMIPRVQAEFQYFKDNGNFPGTGDYGNFKRIIGSQVRQKDISPVDGWFGSMTSQQAYPVLTDTDGRNWGTDYDAFIANMKKNLDNKYATR